ncbi:MAG: ribosomal RNA small subunit methyltransferase A [Nitrospirae bacterium]|nr:ribosomal RNA small subunit methyltransferase A [Nitrospirota bacterium]
MVRPLRDVFRETALRPSKSLGQNFLHQKGIIEKIVSLAEVDREDRILEIGSGSGFLTEALAKRARKVWAFELDRRLIESLRREMGAFPNVEVIHADAMDFEKWVPGGSANKVVANLPYSIATVLTLKLLWASSRWVASGESRDGHVVLAPSGLELLCLMVQREVANRMTAAVGSKEYGFLGVMCQAFSVPSIAWKVSAENFVPRPEVESAVVLFRLPGPWRDEIPDPEVFRKIVSAAFGHRRKTILNSLRRADPKLELSDEVIEIMMKAAGAGNLTRAQELTVEQFVQLSNAYSRSRS